MRFPPHWAAATRGTFKCWRWSFESQEDAQKLAARAAQEVAARFEQGDLPGKQGGYYPDRPLREPVLHELKDATGGVIAVVSRNSYGCEILNTARVMFVDIDLPEARPAGGFLKKLFGGGSGGCDPQAAAIALVENWTQGHADWGWRIYRTCAGLRLLATHGLVDADSPAADAAMEALGSDPLYRRLCRTQKCFRARLTPKHWRCGVRQKPPRWPWADARAEKWFQTWNRQYESLAFNWATCEFLKTAGNPQIHPDIVAVLEWHDRVTKAGIRSKLA